MVMVSDQSSRTSSSRGDAAAARRASASRKRKWPPGVRTALRIPSRAQRVTVEGETPKRRATSPVERSAFPEGVSDLGVRASSGVGVRLLIVPFGKIPRDEGGGYDADHARARLHRYSRFAGQRA